MPLAASARELLEAAQRLASEKGAPRTEPIHVLAAIVASPGGLAYRALVDLNVNLEALRNSLDIGEGGPAPSTKLSPIGSGTRYTLNNAHREAQQYGHHRVDALHILLALLYSDSPSTAEPLEKAGLSIYAVRQYLAAGGPATAARGRPRPAFDGALSISPVFAIPLGAMVIGGIGLWFGVAPSLTFPLSILFVVGGWITSLCLHEFGHALIAYIGGDRSVASAGYLSLNPLKYTNPLLSIFLPVAFLLIGGIGLPGGAVYLNEQSIRNNWWRSLASAGGPLGNLIFAALIGWPFIVFQGPPAVGDTRFWAATAFLVFLQVTAIVLNLLPIPPFDGFGIIAPWLPIGTRIAAARFGMLPLLVLFFLLWTGGPISSTFWNFIFGITNALQVPNILLAIGQQQIRL